MKNNPEANKAVREAESGAVHRDVYWAVTRAVWEAVNEAVYGAVYGAADWAVWRAVRNSACQEGSR